MPSRGIVQRIRTLKAGESIPTSEPRRYADRDGYIRLRWRVARGLQVEVREHRVVNGAVTDAPHRHHRNHVKDDNRPENLVSLTHSEHSRIHARPKFDVDAAQRLYEDGLSTVEIGERLGVHAATVWRRLYERGVSMRPPGVNTERARERLRAAQRRSWQNRDRTAHAEEGRRRWAELTPEQQAETVERLRQAVIRYWAERRPDSRRFRGAVPHG